MAEIVERNIQATVAEVEDMERLGLLDKKEIVSLIDKRREFEYRLIRTTKSKADFINSIKYEKKLMDLLKIRRKKLRMHEKFKEIEGAISLRIMKRCRYMTRYWPDHHDTWSLRINFARAIGWKSEATVAYAEQIHYHGQIESVYIEWAKFEIEERDNFDAARKILLSKAALYHPKSVLIKRELFRLELLYVESLKKKQAQDKAITEVIEENREKVLACEIPRAVYRDAIKVIPDQQLYLELYQVADKFSFAHELREEIYKDLVDTFPNSESMWKLEAQRVVMGIQFKGKKKEDNDGSKKSEDSNYKVDLESDSLEDKGDTEFDLDSYINKLELFEKNSSTTAKKLKKAIETYDKALDAVGPSFLPTYVEELLLMLRDGWSSKVMPIVIAKLLELFETNKKHLLPVHFVIWVHLIQRKPDSEELAEEILKQGFTAHPDCPPLCVEYLKSRMWKEIPHDPREVPSSKILKKFRVFAKKAKGAYSLKIWEEILLSIRDNKARFREYIAASNHNDDIVAREMRLQYLETYLAIKQIHKVKDVYERYCKTPPFSGRFFAAMISGVLTKTYSDINYARKVFEDATMLLAKTHPDFWLAYIYFEKYATGLNVGALYTRAEKELEPEQAEIFRELDAFVKAVINEKNVSAEEKDEDSKPDSIWVTKEEHEEPEVEKKANICLFPELPMLTYTNHQERKEFFKVIHDTKKLIETGYTLERRKGSDWEDVMENLTGMKIPLTVQKVILKSSQVIEDFSDSIKEQKKKNKYELSDQLVPSQERINMKSDSGDLDKILQKSATLKPEFMQKTELSPYFISKKRAKAIRKKEREKTKGPGWYDMKAPEMTDELKRDLEILQMRPILDPKRPFKNKDLKVLPKYFQMGVIQDSPSEFYSSRIPSKKRKRTMAEEILNDEEALRYQKRKFNEIITKKQKQEPKRNSEGGKKKKVKKNKIANKAK